MVMDPIPEAWAKGLILLNWDFVNQLWENRIETSTSPESGIDKRDNHYFLVQKAIREFDAHQIHNDHDRKWILKTHDEITALSSNQLTLWINNISILNHINEQEQTRFLHIPSPNGA